MNKFVGRWLAMSLAVLLASYIIPGIVVTGPLAAIVAALMLGLVNAIVRPLLIILTLPITLLTFGLFLLVINAFMLQLVSGLINGFFVVSFGWAFIGSIAISILNTILYSMIKGRDERSRGRR